MRASDRAETAGAGFAVQVGGLTTGGMPGTVVITERAAEAPEAMPAQHSSQCNADGGKARHSGEGENP